MNNVVRHAVALLAAVLTTAALASLVQTQINISALVDLAAVVPFLTRLTVTAEDVARFGPVMAAITSAALVPALLIGNTFAGLLPRAWRIPLLSLAAAVGMWVAIVVMGLFTPMPALVEATRGHLGLLLMCLTGAPGGVVYAAMTRARVGEGSSTNARYLSLGAALLALPVAVFVLMAPKPGGSLAPVDPAAYSVQTLATGLNRPWSVVVLPDGRGLVTEMRGRVIVVPGGQSVATPLSGKTLPIAIDLKDLLIKDEKAGGLMDVVLDPEFASNRLVYFSVTYGELGATGMGIVSARLAGDRLQDLRVLFRTPPTASSGNFGGRMAFLHDGTLAFTVGDGLDWRERAQDPASHLGKVLRIDRQGRAPADNPFYGKAGVAQEIYSLGHRNPQGIAVDADTGAVFISEHGARGGDEINIVEPGKNYGWPVVTGGIDYSFARVTPFTRLAGYIDPVLTWTPSIAPAGLAVYAGTLFPQWKGDLFVPALKERSLRRVMLKQGAIVGQQRMLADLNERIRDVKVAPDGSLYVLTDGSDAKLLRIVPKTSL